MVVWTLDFGYVDVGSLVVWTFDLDVWAMDFDWVGVGFWLCEHYTIDAFF